MLMENVIVAIAIGSFSFISVLVVKVASIFIPLALKNCASALMRQYSRPG